MRHLDDEHLPEDRLDRDWIRQPPIIQALVKNPKVPLASRCPWSNVSSCETCASIGRDPNLPEGRAA